MANVEPRLAVACRRRMARVRRRMPDVAALVVIALVAIACGRSTPRPGVTGSTASVVTTAPEVTTAPTSTTGSTTAATSTPAPTSGTAVEVVALGDSDATGAGDPTGVGWVGAYAKLLEQQLGEPVAVQNLAVDGTSSDALLHELRTDRATQDAVSSAQIVLIGIGGADLNAGDERLQAGACTGRQCYVPVLRRFDRNFDAIVARVRALGDGPVAIRAMSLPNGLPGAESIIPAFITPEISLFQAETELHTVCRTMQKYGGRCVDVLHAFNGPSGTRNAYAAGLMNLQDCCYPSTKGQQLIARLFVRTGLAPFRQ